MSFNTQAAYLADLFRACSQLRSGFNRFEKEAEQVRGISMNASVVAGQLGSQMKAHAAIANQIAISANRMKQKTMQMRTQVNFIVNITLNAQIINARVIKLQMALPQISGTKNQTIVQKSIHIDNKKLSELMLTVFGHIHTTHSLLKTMLQYQYRMIAALNTLKVESVDLAESHLLAMRALENSLIETTGTSIERLDEVQMMLKGIKKQAETIDHMAREEIYETLYHS